MAGRKKMTNITSVRVKVVTDLEAKGKAQEVLITRFLESNSRRDRDALIRKRAEIQTLKALKDELFQPVK